MSSSSDSPKLVAQSADIEGNGNFPQGCCFSPDGLCVLTSTAADSKLRLYNTSVQQGKGDEGDATVSTWKTALTSTGYDTVRSYDWYPTMKSSDPSSCCFLATCRDQPIHLFDAYSGAVRATYRPYNALDEMESPTVVTFSPNGQRIFSSGFRSDRTIHVFETARPGRDSTVLRLGKTRRSSDGQKGLVSAVSFAPNGNFFCIGTYSPGSIYLYDERTGQQPNQTIRSGLAVVGHGRSHASKKRHFAAMANDDNNDETDLENILTNAKRQWFHKRAQGGITQLTFAPNQEFVLYSASRHSNAVLAWDLRMLSGNPEYQSNQIGGMGSYETDSDTNQRLEFDFNDMGDTLYVGGRDKCVRIYNVASGRLSQTIEGLDDAANGVSVCRVGEKQRYLAVATGSRRFPSEEDLDKDDGLCQDPDLPPGHLLLYSLT